jgi:CheY-like chemotaxis protein
MSHRKRKSIILIVEDDETNAEALALVISSETSCHPFVASNGEDAIRAAQETLPDLLLIDYNLPGIDGIQTYEQIRTIEGLENVPAIFLSATVNIEDLRERNLITIGKPYELDELLALVATQLEPDLLRENGPPMIAPVDGSTSSEK